MWPFVQIAEGGSCLNLDLSQGNKKLFTDKAINCYVLYETNQAYITELK